MNERLVTLSEERYGAIADELAASGRVLASELAQRFGVSEATIRRDLRELAEAGLCRKVYGGAIAPAPLAGSIDKRAGAEGEAKAALAQTTVGLLQPRQTLFLDAGSTNMAVARALPTDWDLTVATNAPAILAILMERPPINVVVLGGVVDRVTGASVGAATLAGINQLHADICILGACGVDPNVGATAFEPNEADVKRAMVARSTRVVVAATTSKLATAAPFLVCQPDAISDLVIERDAPASHAGAFQAKGIAVHLTS